MPSDEHAASEPVDRQNVISPPARSALVACFAVTIFLSAFLLFQVQPLVSKAILPWYGGTPNVWTTCMLFFQVLLFAGYAYAHWSTQWLRPRGQGTVHLALLAAAIVMPILPSAGWRPTGDEQPTLSILLLLTAHVGLPYFMLAATSPLIQYWWDRASMAGSPYRLYAVSNAGSLLALLSYPFVVEPLLPLSVQGRSWSVAFMVFAALVTVCGSTIWWRSLRRRPDELPYGPEKDSRAATRSTPLTQRLLWVALAAAGSVMLLATTNHISHDIAVVPLLWIAPLSLYLLTYILCFAGWGYPRWTAVTVMVVITFYIALDQAGAIQKLADRLGTSVTEVSGVADNYLAALVTYLLAMFVCCMVCHGEMARLKPPPSQLTSYYLHMSFGGALGGIAVAIGGPWLLSGHYELHLGMILCWLLLFAVLYFEHGLRLHVGRSAWAWTGASLLYGVFAFILFYDMLKTVPGRVAVSRNFYGVLAVNEENPGDKDHHHFELVNGLILHGVQYVRDDKRRWATSYYSRQSGVGRAMTYTVERPNRRVGIVGLGTGSMAVYGTENDYFRFYEIDPDVVTFANRYFTYLEENPAECDVVVGDARISLERELEAEDPQNFDVLVLDAFSSDAIPAHLLTLEAVELYLRHLRNSPERQGILVVHISNRYLDLLPVLQAAAARYDLDIVQVKSSDDKANHCLRADWVLLSRPGGLDEILETAGNAVPAEGEGMGHPWTDDYTNILSVLE